MPKKECIVFLAIDCDVDKSGNINIINELDDKFFKYIDKDRIEKDNIKFEIRDIKTTININNLINDGEKYRKIKTLLGI